MVAKVPIVGTNVDGSCDQLPVPPGLTGSFTYTSEIYPQFGYPPSVGIRYTCILIPQVTATSLRG